MNTADKTTFTIVKNTTKTLLIRNSSWFKHISFKQKDWAWYKARHNTDVANRIIYITRSRFSFHLVPTIAGWTEAL